MPFVALANPPAGRVMQRRLLEGRIDARIMKRGIERDDHKACRDGALVRGTLNDGKT